ncbi:hypothetical protein CRENBAI_003733 [Crenichthys baileyi]|uniref:Uncharacterized protein n=1 Tax=Crenichthys baileyi TaxID=28760 RepID=A0AAV9RVD0_9TELE
MFYSSLNQASDEINSQLQQRCTIRNCIKEMLINIYLSGAHTMKSLLQLYRKQIQYQRYKNHKGPYSNKCRYHCETTHMRRALTVLSVNSYGCYSMKEEGKKGRGIRHSKPELWNCVCKCTSQYSVL